MSTFDNKKIIACTFYHIAVIGAVTLIINFPLEKGKIVGKIELKFYMRDGGKLFMYLSAGEFIRQKWLAWFGYLLYYCLNRTTFCDRVLRTVYFFISNATCYLINSTCECGKREPF